MRKLIAIILCFISLIPAYAQNNSNAANSQTLLEQPVDLVNPLIGSDRCRNFFMTAAARPFGMVKLAPDTEISGYQRGAFGLQTFFQTRLEKYKIAAKMIYSVLNLYHSFERDQPLFGISPFF